MTIYLLVKEHKNTGLLYFCKTTRKDPISYRGSGLRWGHHLKKHGAEIRTRKLWKFEDQEKCSKFALRFSKFYNISKSDKWANIREENGCDGMPKGGHHSEETKEKLRQPRAPHTRRPMSEETKQKIRGKRKQYKKSDTYWHHKWGPNPFKS